MPPHTAIPTAFSQSVPSSSSDSEFSLWRGTFVSKARLYLADRRTGGSLRWMKHKECDFDEQNHFF